MAEDQVMGNGDMPNSEQISEMEKNFVDILAAAEQGDEDRRKFLNELPAEQIGAIYKVFKPSTMLRLAEYYCLSFETAGMAAAMASVITEDLKKFLTSPKKLDLERVQGVCILAHVFPYADRQRDRGDEKVIDARAHISALATTTDARKGYALAQYWMGRMAEDGINYEEGKYSRFDTLSWAIDWYEQAAEQGVADAQKRLPGLLTKRKQKLEKEEREKRMRMVQCIYCGGTFKGIFKKVCQACGKPKNY